MRPHFPHRGLYAITDCSGLDAATLISRTRTLVRGGIAVLQYRNKAQLGTGALAAARVLRALCRHARIPFLVNDDLELAQALAADGVHLGRNDASPETARHTLGRTAIIGLSCYNDVHKARRARARGANYIAIGAFYSSTSKRDTVPVKPSLLHAARRATSLPIVAIGGITPDNGGQLLDAGADLLAAISGLYQARSLGNALAGYQKLFTMRGRH